MTDTPLMAKALFDRISAAGIALHNQPYAVNIGCEDGKGLNDPVYPLFASGFSGLAIDGANHPSLNENLGPLSVDLRAGTYVYPTNIVSILRDARCPMNCEFIKIDIDGYDAAIMNQILKSGFRPVAIQMELNPEIPPPIAFSVGFHHDYIPGGQTGFFGCSLAYAVDLTKKFDYVLVNLDFATEYTHDALFVRRDVLSWGLELIELDPREAFLGQPANTPHITTASPEQKLGWREISDWHRLRDEIWHAMANANEQKHGHRNVPFELYISE